MTKAAFHCYPSAQHAYARYDRSLPFRADVVEFDVTGEYDPLDFCFTASSAKVMHFTFNMLFGNVMRWTYLTPLLFIKRAGWTEWKELCGTDMCVEDSAGTPLPQGSLVSRVVHLQPGDSVQARPCQSGTQANLTLVNAVSIDGINTCNYFEGFEV